MTPIEQAADKYAKFYVPNPDKNDAPYYTTKDRYVDLSEAFEEGAKYQSEQDAEKWEWLEMEITARVTNENMDKYQPMLRLIQQARNVDTNNGWISVKDRLLDTSRVTRVEVIDHYTPSGRLLTTWHEDMRVELELQDDERTMKIFLSKVPLPKNLKSEI